MEKNSKFVFDKNINSFSPEGRLYQVEYSIKASEISGSTCIATKGFDTICVIEDKKKNSGDETITGDSISFVPKASHTIKASKEKETETLVVGEVLRIVDSIKECRSKK